MYKRQEFAQIFANIIGTYIVSKGTYDKDIKGSVLIRTDDVELKDLTVDGDLIIGCGAADGKIVLDNVTVKGRLLVWGGGKMCIRDRCSTAWGYPPNTAGMTSWDVFTFTTRSTKFRPTSCADTIRPVSYTHLDVYKRQVQSRPVSKTEKILFPIIVTIFVILLLPSTAPLIGCLMLGNLFRECGCTDRLSDTVQNALMNIVTIFLSTSVGATMVASNFLKAETLKIIFLGLVAFGISTAGGLIGGNIMCKLSGKKVNPLIGSAGVSAVPMAARVSQMVGQKANPANFLLMHAMGPNVAGVIGSAIAAGFLLAVFG